MTKPTIPSITIKDHIGVERTLVGDLLLYATMSKGQKEDRFTCSPKIIGKLDNELLPFISYSLMKMLIPPVTDDGHASIEDQLDLISQLCHQVEWETRTLLATVLEQVEEDAAGEDESTVWGPITCEIFPTTGEHFSYSAESVLSLSFTSTPEEFNSESYIADSTSMAYERLLIIISSMFYFILFLTDASPQERFMLLGSLIYSAKDTLYQDVLGISEE